MRKYFLLSAVAMLMTTTANATTDYAEVTAKATIQVAGTIECTDIDYGTIVVKQGNEKIHIVGYDEYESKDILSITTVRDQAVCYTNDGYSQAGDFSYPNSVTLSGTTSDTPLTLTLYDPAWGANNDAWLMPELTIPANVKADTYTGSFTMTYTY